MRAPPPISVSMQASRPGGPESASRVRPQRLRSTVLGLLVLLTVQFALGMVVNLNVHVPAGRSGYGPAAPALLLHAVVGILLIAGSITLAVRAVAARTRQIVVPAIIAVLVLRAAAVNGVTFLGTGVSGASLAMAFCPAVAIFCYSLILYRLPGPGLRLEPGAPDGRRSN